MGTLNVPQKERNNVYDERKSWEKISDETIVFMIDVTTYH